MRDPSDDYSLAGEDAEAVQALLSQMRPAWHRYAACQGKPTEMFFPSRGHPVEPAKEVCARCLVRVECLEELAGMPALLRLWGIRGGLSARERRRAGVLAGALEAARAERAALREGQGAA